MFDEIRRRHVSLTSLINRHCKEAGVMTTTIPSLYLIRLNKVSEPVHRVYNPSFCFVTQGLKVLHLAEERLEYGPSNYLITSVNLPVIGQVVEASPESSYLSLKLELNENEIFEVLNGIQIHANPKIGD